MPFRLIQKREVWCPTWLGAACLFSIFTASLAFWALRGEAVLSATDRLPAEVLIVEAWIGAEGAEAAAMEFKDGRVPYQKVVAAGGLMGAPWARKRWSYVEIAENEFSRAGVSTDKFIAASTPDVESLRTYETALAARRALEVCGLQPKVVNIFTRGAHGCRSRLTFTRVFGPDIKVGIICWIPPGQDAGPWWASTERTSEFLKESLACPYELIFHFVPERARTLFGFLTVKP